MNKFGVIYEHARTYTAKNNRACSPIHTRPAYFVLSCPLLHNCHNFVYLPVVYRIINPPGLFARIYYAAVAKDFHVVRQCGLPHFDFLQNLTCRYFATFYQFHNGYSVAVSQSSKNFLFFSCFHFALLGLYFPITTICLISLQNTISKRNKYIKSKEYK